MKNGILPFATAGVNLENTKLKQTGTDTCYLILLIWECKEVQLRGMGEEKGGGPQAWGDAGQKHTVSGSQDGSTWEPCHQPGFGVSYTISHTGNLPRKDI